MTICSSCGAVEDFTLPKDLERSVETALIRAARRRQFIGSHHRLDLLGVCSSVVSNRPQTPTARRAAARPTPAAEVAVSTPAPTAVPTPSPTPTPTAAPTTAAPAHTVSVAAPAETVELPAAPPAPEPGASAAPA